MTNGDKIRAMSDEELLDFLYGRFLNCPPNSKSECPLLDCDRCWLDWLKKEA